MACGATGEARGALGVIVAEAELWAAANLSAHTSATEAMSWLPRGSARWCDAVGIAAVGAGRTGAHAELESLARQLEAVAPLVSEQDKSAYVAAVGGLIRQLLFAGAHERVTALCSLVDRVPAAALTLNVQGRMHSVHVVRASNAGDLSGCLEHAQLAVHLHDAAGDLRSACMARTWVAYAFVELGALESAVGVLHEAIEGAKRLGATIATAAAFHNLGNVRLRQGRLSDAIAHEMVAVEAFAANGDRRMESRSRLYVARSHAAARSFEAAEQEALRALEVAGTAPDRALAWATLAQVALSSGDAAAAVEKARPAVELLAQLGALEEGESLLRLVYAEALHESGDTEGARAAIREARDQLHGRAAKIGSPEWRHRFITDVPENARTLALARTWGA